MQHKIKFIVYAPGDYSPFSGGGIALHKLAHNISSLGEETYIMTSRKNDAYLGTQVNESEAQDLVKYNDSMVIYPEVTCGNPLYANHCMRWILYYVRNWGEHGIFGANDLIYKYAEYFTLRYDAPIKGELRAVELNLHLFEDKKQPRSGSCYLVKKNPDKEHIHPSDSLKIDEFFKNGGNEYLANVFNEKEIFYCYDSATWIAVMAALCGCKVIVIPDNGVNPIDYYNQFPYFKYGIAYGLSEIDHANNTRHLLREQLLKLENQTILQTKQFIADSYKLIHG